MKRENNDVADAAAPKPPDKRPWWSRERTEEDNYVARFLALLDGLRVERWMDKGSCRDSADPDAWFPQSGAHQARTKLALSICRSCPVRTLCLDYAMTQPPDRQVTGIWGGLTAQQRKTIRDKRKTRPA